MDFFNYILGEFEMFGETVVNALPGSPVVWLQTNETIQKYLSWVNWFIPIYSIIAVYEVWIACIVIYYAMQVILRWFKVIE